VGPLTAKEMGDLRSYSTRARITPTSFVNDYSWGDFKGDAYAWMKRYFDALQVLHDLAADVLTGENHLAVHRPYDPRLRAFKDRDDATDKVVSTTKHTTWAKRAGRPDNAW
jgi:hypothetical protein